VLAFGGSRAVESEVRALLGTLDRRHVEAILNALAANDGAALMACVARLDERAPDYDQALGELAASVQRMALLLALPELRGEDEEQDALLAQLAARFAPEDLQLLYQIAIMARRDLDFAPDARGGFEMALLRMLSFRPASVGGAAAPTPATGERRAAGGGTPAATPARATGTSPTALSPAGGPAASGGQSAAAGGDWPAIVAQLGLAGTAAQLAAHCTLVGRKGELVRLRLDRAGESFRRPQVEQRLAQALEKYYGAPVRLEIAVSDAAEVTPARLQAQAADERQRAAEQAIESDANVRALRETFGATVVPGSVRPLN
jgi:DNA polymerase-3 subunit gamma/tau